MSPEEEEEVLYAEIRDARVNRGWLLGPLTAKYGSRAVVRALGVGHMAWSLGVPEEDEMREEEE